MPTIHKEILIDALPEKVKEGRMPLLHHHTDFLPEHLATEIQACVNRGAEVMKKNIEAEAKGDHH